MSKAKVIFDLERCLVECQKIKADVIAPPNQNKRSSQKNQSEIKESDIKRGKICTSKLLFLIGWKIGNRFVYQSRNAAMQKQSKHRWNHYNV